ncbi:MAG TPA: S8 family serine peptidase [Solirubrobacteraceae bacterium]|jgi:subtilisin family serine protease|nr:S8 family serine peptidase [Solirubrobacteraceae bacterium]
MDRNVGLYARWNYAPRKHSLLPPLALAAAIVCAMALGAFGGGARAGAGIGVRGPVRPLGRAAHTNPYRSGVVLVGFRAGVSASQRQAIERAAGGGAARRLGPAIKPVGHGALASQEYMAPYALRVPAKHELAVAAALRRFSGVAYAEPDYMQAATATPNDPSFSVQWADRNTGQLVATQQIEEIVGPPASGTPGADDGAYKAWQLTTGSRSIVIGEVDTGVDYTHPDLAANIWSNPGHVGGCPRGTHGFNVIKQNCEPMDEDTTYGGHGTHVAGILGAVGNNGAGVTGMNWQTSILPVKWMNNASGGSTSALIEALQWLVAARQEGVNVRVVNDSDTFFGTAYSQALSNEIDVLGANNILFVTSAGNTGNNNDEVAVQRYPCSYDRPTEICVAPVDNHDQLPSWANYGAHTVDLAAPGVSIYSTLRGGTYGYMSGSSMAAPQVAGAAALILSLQPAMSTTGLRSDILEHVDRLPSLAGRVITGGTLDVCKALPGCASLYSQVPVNTGLPALSGLPVLGQALGVVHGTWTNEPSSYAYQWQRCEASGANCQRIQGATGSTYLSFFSDLGHTLRVTETASNAAGAGTPVTSAASTPVVSVAPQNRSRPAIAGLADVGQTLTAEPGTWTEGPTSYAYQWQRCDAKGANCAPIAEANAATYTLTLADGGATLRVVVIASNGAGASAPATSSHTAAVAVPHVPTSTAAPTIEGPAAVGRTLTEAPGKWTGEPSSFTHQWTRCDNEGENCRSISGATGQTYVPVSGDTGHALRVLETARNAGGPGAPASSAPTAAVVATAPAGGRANISGATNVGQVLSATSSNWSEEPTVYAYKWQRCDAKGANCAPIAEATGATYTLGEGDAGATLRVAVVASNAAGTSGPATSTQTAVVHWQQPVNTAPPTITGLPQAGQTLTANPGAWSGVPTAYSYQWQRCDATGANCQAIAGSTSAKYAIGEADAQHTLRVAVSASNPAGKASPATSAQTRQVIGSLAPTNVSPPQISGTEQQAETLTETHGSWTGEPTSFTYQWMRCDASGGNCQPLYGATGQTYSVRAGDVGQTLRVQETATNATGTSNPEGSGATAIVTAQPGAATFGKTAVGAFADEGLFANYKIVQSATLPVAGKVSQLSVYAVPGLKAPSPQAVRAVIYADAGGTPGALLASGPEVVYRSNVNGKGWFDLPLASPLALEPGTYWIGFMTGESSEGMGYVYDSVASSRAYNENAFGAGPSDPFGAATLDSEQGSVYASYLPG